MTERKIPEELRPRAQGECVFHQNPTINRALRTPVWVPWLVYLPVVAITAWIAYSEFNVKLWQVGALFLLGWFSWTLTEYVIHRFLYHTPTNKEWFKRFQMRAHGIHHQHPKDPYCLAMPVFLSILFATGILFLFWLLMKEKGIAFYSGYLFGYIFYLFIHYAQHRWTPKQVPKFAYPLWEHHVIHHYKDPFSNFGVSTRFWDMVFGTMYKDPKKHQK